MKQKNKEDPVFISIGGVIIGMILLGGLMPSWGYLVDIGFSGLLVYITLVYTSFTKKILEDGKKKREIEYIQRQLEYFYYPLLRIMEKAERKKIIDEKENAYEILANEDDESYSNPYSDYNDLISILYVLIENNIEELYKYKYLSSADIRKKYKKIEQYLESVEDDDEYFLEDYQEQTQTYTELKSLKEDLESEIKDLNNKLIDLIN